ncbi:MAG: DUF1829 domain-containing protein [Nitrospirae bacterium]|nr:DUF1829 domain-containing protein [Nitrospirota bacterium]MBF0592235.1 DUF1829 domain-containing protein [Nitrospirota bacterium]
MIDDIRERMRQYSEWIRDITTLQDMGNGWVQITTPHLDRHNDCLQVYVKKQNGGYIMTDDGYIITDLLHSGCKLDSPKRQELLKTTLAGFGVKKEGDALEVYATSENFAIKKHNFIQAMLAVNDMFFLAKPYVASLFYEEVVSWLDIVEIRYTPNVKFTGKSGFDNLFNFVIPKSRSAPERVLQVINKPTRNAVQDFVFRWLDTREVRSSNSKAYGVLNDQESPVSSHIIEAFKQYDTEPVLWSKREDVVSELAA